jgi:hypothetical protein
MNILSLGAGVNSTALLVLKAQSKIDFEFAIFADTGDENPKTYAYIEQVIKPFCQKHNIDLEIVRNQEHDGETLSQYCQRTKFIPSRQFGSCRDHFKIQTIRKYLKKNFPTVYKEINTFIGFCKGEESRAKGYVGITANYDFPLIDFGLDRKDCIQIIREAGLPIPIKSGCIFCPHQSLESWIILWKESPDLYAKAEALEKNGRRYPELYLSWESPLEVLRHSLEANERTIGPKEKEQMEKLLYSYMPKTKGCSMCEIEDNTFASLADEPSRKEK